MSGRPASARGPETSVASVESGDALQALSHPLRIRVLEALREPAAAAEVARRIGQPRQKVNYHLKELERAGLVTKVGERRTGNFIEGLYRSVASAFVVSPRVAWGDPRRAQALADQISLESLVLLGERLQQDAAGLLDRAAFDGEQIASASVESQVRFTSEEDRAAFMKEYLKAVGPLLKRYAAEKAEGEPYRVILAAYPDPSEDREGRKP